MVQVGKLNALRIVRTSDFGLLLDGGDAGEILLPTRQAPPGAKPGAALDVFIHLDSEERLVATTDRPKAMVGEFACLRVVSATPVGAFLDWGLPKDLFVPFREQKIPMRAGESYVVAVYFDRASGRLAASSKLDKFLRNPSRNHAVGEAVALLVCGKTDLGYKAIVGNGCWGMLFFSDVFQPLRCGQRLEGFVKSVRPDGRIDLCLHKPGYEKVTRLTDVVLAHLEANGGFLPVTDKTAPEAIHAMFGVSKKTYKKAVGALYKKRRIVVEADGIRLAPCCIDRSPKKIWRQPPICGRSPDQAGSSCNPVEIKRED